MITEHRRIKKRGYSKTYAKKYPEKIKEYQKNHVIDKKKYDNEYRKSHPDKVKERDSKNIIRRRENKIKAVEYLGDHCADCKNEFPYYVYDFHHTDPTIKDFEISHIMGRKWENIVPELNKCVLLCANCHRIRENKNDYM